VKRSSSPDPKPLREILPRLLKEVLGPRGKARDRLREAWSEVVGAADAQRTRLVGVEDGVLTVEVASAALKHDLEFFRREEVLSGLREKLPALALQKVRYRAGG